MNFSTLFTETGQFKLHSLFIEEFGTIPNSLLVKCDATAAYNAYSSFNPTITFGFNPKEKQYKIGLQNVKANYNSIYPDELNGTVVIVDRPNKYVINFSQGLNEVWFYYESEATRDELYRFLSKYPKLA